MWNGDQVGSTATRYNTLDPRWDPCKESFDLRLLRNHSLSDLYIDVWDMDNAGTKKRWERSDYTSATPPMNEH